jgi:hypothetical protein
VPGAPGPRQQGSAPRAAFIPRPESRGFNRRTAAFGPGSAEEGSDGCGEWDVRLAVANLSTPPRFMPFLCRALGDFCPIGERFTSSGPG